jgi:hypothetical protein
MVFSFFRNLFLTIFSIILIVSLYSCTDELQRYEVIYDNDFSQLDLEGYENGQLYIWRNDTILGFYHNEEVALNLKNIPPHNILKITSEILIHDSWDGNSDDGFSGPDFWFFGVDDLEVFRTTFSNLPCESNFCYYQSFPNPYIRQNLPQEGAIDTNMPGLCLFGGFPRYTSRYRIEKLVTHKERSARIYWNSRLREEAAPDPKCNESWSLARVTVEAIVLN